MVNIQRKDHRSGLLGVVHELETDVDSHLSTSEMTSRPHPAYGSQMVTDLEMSLRDCKGQIAYQRGQQRREV